MPPLWKVDFGVVGELLFGVWRIAFECGGVEVPQRRALRDPGHVRGFQGRLLRWNRGSRHELGVQSEVQHVSILVQELRRRGKERGDLRFGSLRYHAAPCAVATVVEGLLPAEDLPVCFTPRQKPRFQAALRIQCDGVDGCLPRGVRVDDDQSIVHGPPRPCRHLVAR